MTCTGGRLAVFFSYRGLIAAVLLALIALPSWSMGQLAQKGDSQQEPEAEAKSTAASDHPAVAVASQADVIRDVVSKWVNLVKSGNLNDSWSLTTKSVDIDGHDELPKLWAKEQVHVERSLGSNDVAMVITNVVSDNSARERAMVFRLVRKHSHWFIDNSGFVAHDQLEPLIRGFRYSPGVEWHVLPSNIAGSWATAGFAVVNFTDDGTIRGASDPDSGSDDILGTWRLRDDRLIRRINDNEIEHRIVWIQNNMFQLESLDGRSRWGYHRVQAQSK
jgi:hypothetical protein